LVRRDLDDPADSFSGCASTPFGLVDPSSGIDSGHSTAERFSPEEDIASGRNLKHGFAPLGWESCVVVRSAR